MQKRGLHREPVCHPSMQCTLIEFFKRQLHSKMGILDAVMSKSRLNLSPATVHSLWKQQMLIKYHNNTRTKFGECYEK